MRKIILAGEQHQSEDKGCKVLFHIVLDARLPLDEKLKVDISQTPEMKGVYSTPNVDFIHPATLLASV